MVENKNFLHIHDMKFFLHEKTQPQQTTCKHQIKLAFVNNKKNVHIQQQHGKSCGSRRNGSFVVVYYYCCWLCLVFLRSLANVWMYVCVCGATVVVYVQAHDVRIGETVLLWFLCEKLSLVIMNWARTT